MDSPHLQQQQDPRPAPKNLPRVEDREQYDRDRRWLSSHRKELLKKYAEQWVAVYKEDVVAFHPRLDGLVDELQRHNLAHRNVAADRITSRRVNMLL